MQADLKTFAALQVFGTSAISALTAQNSLGVRSVHAVPPRFLVAQVEAVLDDLDVRAVKAGMLLNAENVGVVAALAAAGRLPQLVVDPVMVSASGDRLLEQTAEQAYVEELLPQAMVLTPNLPEAQVLLSARIETLTDRREAARALGALGPRVVVLTGGGGEGDAVDMVWNGTTVSELRTPRVETRNTHGTGCTFAAAITAGLARGHEVDESLRRAKAYVSAAICGAALWHLGAGPGPLNHFGWS